MTLVLLAGAFLLGGCAQLVRGIDAASDDMDQDGWSVFDGDCDDGDPEVNPEQDDFAGDGVDSDCDGEDGW